MRFFDVGQRAEGFIAIGQEAVGVIAIGQLAIGVVAIGQLARGIFVVGQLAVGVVVIGQLAIGVWGGAGMMAITGRWVKGLGVAIWPKRKDDMKRPKPITLAQVKAGQPGYVEVEVEGQGSELSLVHEGEELEVAMGENVRDLAQQIGQSGYPHALARLEQKERLESGQGVAYREAAPTALYLESSRIFVVPRPRWQHSAFWAKAAARSVGVFSLAVVWFVVAIIPLWNALFAAKTTLLPDIFGALSSIAWPAVHGAIWPRFLRCLLTYEDRLRGLLGTGTTSLVSHDPCDAV